MAEPISVLSFSLISLSNEVYVAPRNLLYLLPDGRSTYKSKRKLSNRRQSMIRKSILFFLLAIMLVACNAGATPAPTVDANAINTAAFSTAMAQISGQQTQTALAMPTNTPPPTNTAASLVTAALPTA